MISVIVPVYNERECISIFLEEAAAYSDIGELIIVDDGSEEPCTEEVIRHSGELGLSVRLIRLANNVGKDRAALAGVSSARCELCAVMDADLQYGFDDLIMMKKLLVDEKRDLVIALKKRYFSIWNIIFRLFAILSRAQGFRQNISDFFIGRTELTASVLRRYQDSPVFSLKGVVRDVSANHALMPVEVKKRRHGTTKMNMSRLYEVFNSTTMLSFPNLVRFSFVWCFFFLLFALCYSGSIVYEKIFLGTTPPGYASLIVVELVGFSMVFLFLGILSEYLNAIVKQLIVKKPVSEEIETICIESGRKLEPGEEHGKKAD